VEIVVAFSLLVTTLAGCGYLFKVAASYACRTEAFLRPRSELEQVRSLPFAQAASAGLPDLTVTPVAPDLYLIKAGPLYTLRSKYE